MICGASIAGTPAHTQLARQDVGLGDPPRTIAILAQPRHPAEQLPADIRQALADHQDQFSDAMQAMSASPVGAAIFTFLRFEAPRRERQFLLVGVTKRSDCGPTGCPVYLFERRAEGWHLIEGFMTVSSVDLLGLWRNGYPQFRHQNNRNYVWFHWWDGDRYRRACAPPTQPECWEANHQLLPNIYHPRTGPVADDGFP